MSLNYRHVATREADQNLRLNSLPTDVMHNLHTHLDCQSALYLCKTTSDACPTDVEYWKKCCDLILKNYDKVVDVLERVTLREVTLREVSDDFLNESSGNSYLWWKRSKAETPNPTPLYQDFGEKWINKIGSPAEKLDIQHENTIGEDWFQAMYGINKMRVTANFLSGGQFVTVLDILENPNQQYKLASPRHFNMGLSFMEEAKDHINENFIPDYEASRYTFHLQDNDSPTNFIGTILAQISNLTGKKETKGISIPLSKLKDKLTEEILPKLEVAKYVNNGEQKVVELCRAILNEFQTIIKVLNDSTFLTIKKGMIPGHISNAQTMISDNRRWFVDHYEKLIKLAEMKCPSALDNDKIYLRIADNDTDAFETDAFAIATIKLKSGRMKQIRVVENLIRSDS